MLEACDANIARATHSDGNFGADIITFVREEDRRIKSLTGTFLPP